MQVQTAQKWLAFCRDVGSFVLGTFLLVHQEITQHVNVDLMLGALGLVGAPGAIAVVHLFRGSALPEQPPTTEPSQGSPPLSASPSSSSPQ